MTSFPKGPYSVHPYTEIQGLRTHTREDGSQWDSASITIGAGRTILGEVTYRSNNSDGYPSIQSEDEMHALAALWIAAPELLEALKDFDDCFCDFDPDDQSSRMRMRKVIIRARAAIDKATTPSALSLEEAA